MIRTMIVAGRRGGASSQSDVAGGDHTYYVASVLGGRGDLKVASEGGVTQAPVAAPGRSLEVMPYAVGLASTMSAGFGWTGSGVTATPYAQVVGQEWLETYALGAISGEALAAGTGWNGSGALSTPYVQAVGNEDFETYALGGISGSGLTAGMGWNGSAALIGY